MDRQMAIPFAAADGEDLASKQAIAARLRLLEAAAWHCRIAWHEVGGRILRALGHLCGSKRQLARGLVGLRWSGTVAELAADPMVKASVVRVRAVLSNLEACGIVSKSTVKNWRGQDSGLVVTLEMAAVCKLASRSESDPIEGPIEGAIEGPIEGAIEGAIEGPIEGPIDESYIFIPDIPKYPNPPPSRKSSAAAVCVDPVFGQESPPDPDEVLGIASELASIGLDRASLLADEFAGRGQEVRDAVEVYRSQKSKFRAPGAVVGFLRTGVWPVGGIRSLEEIAAARRAADERSAKAAMARMEFAAARSCPIGGFTDQESAILRDAGLLRD